MTSQADQPPDVSIVIVVYNSRHVVGPCIESILGQPSGLLIEIVVVDNASRDGTGAFVARTFPDVRVLHLPKNIGLSGGINAGVAASSGSLMFQLNPDTILEPATVEVLADYLSQHSDVGIAAPQLVNDDGSLQLSCRAFPGYATALFSRYSLLTRIWPGNPFSRRYLMTDFDHAERADVDWVSGAALMYPRKVHDLLGGWDAGYFLFSEDVDLCKRVHDSGLRVVYVPEARVFHTIGISKKPTRRAIIERHRSMWRYYRKHVRRSPIQDVFTAPVILGRCLLALVRATLRPPA